MRNANILVSIGCGTVLVSALWFSAVQGNVHANTANEQPRRSWERVDLAARNVGAGDEASVRVLVNEVFADDGIGEDIVATSGSVPDRLVAAEVAYQKGEGGAVSDDRVVNAVNQLAQRFNAPPYAYTNIQELRALRLKMLTVYPGFIGRGSAATRDDSKPHFERNLGPVEAFHVTATLIFQKIANPKFQFSPEERQAALQKSNAVATADLWRHVANGERTQELMGIIRQGAATMSLRDMLDQSEQTLDQLGIPR